MNPSSVSNFSPIRVRIRVLWQILRNEDEEENKELKIKFCLSLTHLWRILFITYGGFCQSLTLVQQSGKSDTIQV